MKFLDDERGQALNERSGQIAFLTASILLALVIILDWFKTSEPNFFLLVVLLLIQTAFWSSRAYYRRKGL